MREIILLVIGSVTATQYEEARFRLMQLGYKPKIRRVSHDQMTFIDWDEMIIEDFDGYTAIDADGAILSQMGIDGELVKGVVVPSDIWLNSSNVFHEEVLNHEIDIIHVVHLDGSVEVAR